ncbi:MAG: Stf0 sulfotransferase family protein [Acuticoccus sp.]
MPKTYLIFFTGRSGSTWLKDLCEGTGRLGRPGEIFNRQTGPRNADLPLDEFVPKVIARNTRGGVFGAELTFVHMRDTFGSMARVLDFFPDLQPIFLIREDIVLQSISGVRKRQTKIGHSHNPAAAVDNAGEAQFTYDGAAIKAGINMRMLSEKKLEAAFAEHGLDPLRLSYERNVRNPAGALNAIAERLGEPPFEALPESSYSVLRTDKNEAFAERFRRRHPFYMRRVARARAATLARLVDY